MITPAPLAGRSRVERLYTRVRLTHNCAPPAIRRTEQREALHPRGREARSWHVCTGACHEPPHRRHRCWLWACPALNQGGGARVPGGSPERVLHHGPAHRPPHRHVGNRQLFRLCLAASRLAHGTLTPSAPCSCSVTCCRSVRRPPTNARPATGRQSGSAFGRSCTPQSYTGQGHARPQSSAASVFLTPPHAHPTWHLVLLCSSDPPRRNWGGF